MYHKSRTLIRSILPEANEPSLGQNLANLVEA